MYAQLSVSSLITRVRVQHTEQTRLLGNPAASAKRNAGPGAGPLWLVVDPFAQLGLGGEIVCGGAMFVFDIT